MKKTLLVLSITLLVSLLSSTIKAQVNHTLTLGLVEVCMLNTESATKIGLTLAPTTAGLAIQSSVSDNSKKLQISSIITGTVGAPVYHTVKASLLTGSAVPPGTYLNLQATVPALTGTSGGVLGVTAGDVKLPMVPGSAVNVITGIGSCFSGAAATDGYTLKYTWGVDLAGNYSDIRATAGTGTDVTVVLTLSSVQ